MEVKEQRRNVQLKHAATVRLDQAESKRSVLSTRPCPDFNNRKTITTFTKEDRNYYSRNNNGRRRGINEESLFIEEEEEVKNKEKTNLQPYQI